MRQKSLRLDAYSHRLNMLLKLYGKYASGNAAQIKVSEAAMCALCTQQAGFSVFEAVLSYCDSLASLLVLMEDLRRTIT